MFPGSNQYTKTMHLICIIIRFKAKQKKKKKTTKEINGDRKRKLVSLISFCAGANENNLVSFLAQVSDSSFLGILISYCERSQTWPKWIIQPLAFVNWCCSISTFSIGKKQKKPVITLDPKHEMYLVCIRNFVRDETQMYWRLWKKLH